MVFPNFFITFVRHSFHTSHPSTSPLSRETASPCHQTPHSPHGTRHASRAMHTCCTSQKAMLTRHASSSLTAHPPPHYNPRKRLCSRATHTPRILISHSTHAPTLQPPQRAMPHALLSLTPHTPSTLPPRKGLCHAHAPRAKMPQRFPLQPPPF